MDERRLPALPWSGVRNGQRWIEVVTPDAPTSTTLATWFDTIVLTDAVEMQRDVQRSRRQRARAARGKPSA